MQTITLETNNLNVTLVEPLVNRDAKLGVNWINSQHGHDTLKLMGVADKDNQPTTLKKEQQRVKDFITNPNQLNWMISYNNQIVGAIWVDLKDTAYLRSPSVHIMLGDPNARGKGVGSAAVDAVIKHLAQLGYKQVHSRYLLSNKGSQRLLTKLGFINDGEPYNDSDGLSWQNIVFGV